jgi:hypothetical protein
MLRLRFSDEENDMWTSDGAARPSCATCLQVVGALFIAACGAGSTPEATPGTVAPAPSGATAPSDASEAPTPERADDAAGIAALRQSTIRLWTVGALCENVGGENTTLGEMATSYRDDHRTVCEAETDRCRTTFERPGDVCAVVIKYRLLPDGSLDPDGFDCDYVC